MNILRKITERVVFSLFVVLVAVVFYQVLARYAFNSPPSWTDELARYCQVWIILLTSSICIRKGSHLAVDYLSHRFSQRTNLIIDVFNHLLMVLYICVVLVFGWKLMIAGRYQLSPALQINMLFVYIIFPLSGILMLLEAIIKTATLFNQKSKHMASEHK
jgi:TRAP-type C4-dicarboxylate transport system permease small subunit